MREYNEVAPEVLARSLAQIDVTARLDWDHSPEPFKERYRRLVIEHPRLSSLVAIAVAAHRYRCAETDGTPRLWRGKNLQDLANLLDEATVLLEQSLRYIEKPDG